MGFVKRQQERMAMRYLRWQYQKMELPVPPSAQLEGQARAMVDQARQIARQRGRNVMAILKELVADLKNRS